MDFHATILPGTGAAGLVIGDFLPDTSPDHQRSVSLASVEFKELTYGSVIILSSDKRIVEIALREGYEGKSEKGIGIGSTIREVEQAYGEGVQDDSECNLIIPSTPGWCFDVTTLRRTKFFDPFLQFIGRRKTLLQGEIGPFDPNSRITYIAVYSIERGKLTHYEDVR